MAGQTDHRPKHNDVVWQSPQVSPPFRQDDIRPVIGQKEGTELNAEPVHFYGGGGFTICGEEIPHGRHNTRDRTAVTCPDCLAELLPEWND